MDASALLKSTHLCSTGITVRLGLQYFSSKRIYIIIVDIYDSL